MPYQTIPDPDFPPLSSSTSHSKSKPKQPSATSSTTQPTTKPVFFWRPNDGNGYLSQWFYSPFTVDGDTYATAEMWMMVQKARLFGDEDTAKSMLGTMDPKRHKALGRQVKNFSEKTWDERELCLVCLL